jgi:pimeloyl-ACP methyl ester carboxylesterase
VDWMEANERPWCVYGFAESMGAAGLLQALNGETRFCAVVAESPFSSFREVEYDRIGQFFHTGPWLAESVLRPVVDGTFLYAKWKYGLDFSLVSADRAVASTRVPVLLIHGLADHNVPIRHSRAIAASSGAVELWEVPGADHCGAIGVGREEFARRVVGWFEGHGDGGSLKVAVGGE